GDVGEVVSKVTLTLSEPAAADVAFRVATRCPAGCTATAGDDYRDRNQIVTIKAGQTTGFFTVKTQGQPYVRTAVEADETFVAKITAMPPCAAPPCYTKRDGAGLI